jgi:glycosyltransferase involved in cell wall biosynthesis
MARAHIAEREVVSKARAGRSADIRPCIGCNECIARQYMEAIPFACTVNPSVGYEIPGLPPLQGPARKLLVVGGGPAGMELAATARERGHQVDFVVASNSNAQPHVTVNWFSPANLLANVYDPPSEAPPLRRIARRAKRFLALMYHTHKALRNGNYDFVYCKAFYEGLAGNLVANLHGVPCGMRSMGTMLYEDFKKHGPWLTALRRPAEFLAFRLHKAFFLMTDDGTKGDLVHDAWGPAPVRYDFLFWKTGVELKSASDIRPTLELPGHPYLFYAARVDDWKRHDRVIRLLHLLHGRGHRIHIYFAGVTQSQSFLRRLHTLITEYELQEHVHFLGPIPQDDVRNFAHNAVANPSFYDVSNRGNVFFEIFSVGSVVVGLDDGSLDGYVSHGENGFLVREEEAGARVIEDLLAGKIDGDAIRRRASATAAEKVLSAAERFEREVDLIEAHARSAAPAN